MRHQFLATARIRPPPVPGTGAQRSMPQRAAAPHSGDPVLQAVNARMPGMRMRPAETSRNSVCERAKTKRPRIGTRGRSRVLGRSGSPISRGGKISRWRVAVPCDRRDSGNTQARARPVRGASAAGLAGFSEPGSRCGRNASWEVLCIAIRRYDEGRARYAARFHTASGFLDAT